MKCAVKVIMVGVVAFLNNAYAMVALAQIRIKIVDQDGCAVPDAMIWGGFTCGGGMDDYVLVDGLTDMNGVYVAEGRCNEFLHFDVRKEGYYRTSIKVEFWRTTADPRVKDGKWQPYGETRTVVLKKIGNPISIGEFGRCSISIPVYDKWVGFDFERREWVPPYGNGSFSDVMLKFGRTLVNSQTDFKMTMDVSFTNNPYAGFYQMQEDQFSERKNVCHANEKENFCSSISYVQERHPGFPRKDNRMAKGAYLVFRTRTQVDKDGKLISAHYGIISGQWSFFGTMLSGGYLFNPTPNDTNLEDAETARLSRLGYEQRLEQQGQYKKKTRSKWVFW